MQVVRMIRRRKQRPREKPHGKFVRGKLMQFFFVLESIFNVYTSRRYNICFSLNNCRVLASIENKSIEQTLEAAFEKTSRNVREKIRMF